MRRFELHPVNPQIRLLRQVVDIFQKGGIVVYPTDAGYSMGCFASHHQAMHRLYDLKRNIKKYTMSLIVPDFSSITHFAHVQTAAYRYMKNKLPGPYTFILPATVHGKKLLDVKRPEVGIRMPHHMFFETLNQVSSEPLLNSTARLKVDDFFIDPDEIEVAFKGSVDALVDMGPIPHNPTTVISFVNGAPELVRQGAGEF